MRLHSNLFVRLFSLCISGALICNSIAVDAQVIVNSNEECTEELGVEDESILEDIVDAESSENVETVKLEAESVSDFTEIESDLDFIETESVSDSMEIESVEYVETESKDLELIEDTSESEMIESTEIMSDESETEFEDLVSEIESDDILEFETTEDIDESETEINVKEVRLSYEDNLKAEMKSDAYIRLLSEQENTFITVPSGSDFNMWMNSALESAVDNGLYSPDNVNSYLAQGADTNLVKSNLSIKNIIWADSPSIKTYRLTEEVNDKGEVIYKSEEVLIPITKYEIYHNDEENYSLYMVAVPNSSGIKTVKDDITNETYRYLDINTLYIKADSASIRFKDGDASKLFQGFASLSRLDESLLRRFDMSTSVNMSFMFDGCTNLSQITIPNIWDTSNVTDMSNMFSNIGVIKQGVNPVVFSGNLRINNLSNLVTGKVVNFSSMFEHCSLKELDFTTYDGGSAEDLSNMFSDMYSLESLTLFDRKSGKSFNPYNALSMKEMFKNDYRLKILDLGGFEPVNKELNVEHMLKMDAGVTSLKAICPIATELNSLIELPDLYFDVNMLRYKYMGGTNEDRQKPEYQQDGNRIAPLPSSDIDGQGWLGFNMIHIYFGGGEGDSVEYCDKGSTMPNQVMIDGSTIKLAKNTLTYKNYELVGWTTKQGQVGNNVKAEYEPEAIVTFTQNTRLYPVWNRTTFFITFDHQYDIDADGESEKTVVECDINGSLKEEQIPTSIRDNYGVRWYTQPNGKGTQIKPDEVINSNKDMTVYAFYVQKFYDVIFNPNGGVGEMENQHFLTGKSQYLSPNAFTREGHIFVGWSTNKNEKWSNVKLFNNAKVVDLPDKENSDITLYAIWVKDTEKNVYRIDYDLGDDSNNVNVDSGNPSVYLSTSKDDIVINNPVKIIKSLDEQGNVVSENIINFIGWSGTDIDVLSSNVIIKAGSTGNKLYVAHFEDEVKTITFMSNDEVYKTDTRVYGQPVSEPSTPEYNNQSFQGWYTQDGIEYDFSKPVLDDLVLYAEYSVVLNQNGMDSNINKQDQSTDDINLVKGQIYFLAVENGKLWTSSDKKVITVDKKGKMTAKKVGTATVTNGDIVYNITVVQPKMNVKTLNLAVGETGKLVVENAPKEYTISWSSSNDSVAQVVKGVVYAVGTGTAKVTAYINGVKYTANVKVVNSKAQPKTFESEQVITLYLGQSITPKWNDKKFNITTSTFEMSGKVSKTKDKDQKNYVYSNEYIKVDSNNKYKITAVNAGTTTITFTSKDKTIVKKITVNTVTKVNKADVYLSVGKTHTISTAGIPSSKITWRVASDIEDRKMPELKTNDIAINEVMFAKQAGIELNDDSESDIVIPDSNKVKITKNKVKALAVGDLTIIGEYKVNDTVNIYQFRLHITSPEITPDEYLAQKLNNKGVIQKNKYTLNLVVGTSYAILPMYTEQNLVWKSSKASVATIDTNGVVKTKKAGKCNLTTKINGISVTVALTVDATGADVPESNDFTYKTIRLANNGQLIHISNSGKYYISKK